MTKRASDAQSRRPQRLLDKHHVAKVLGLRPETVARMARRGEIPALKIAGRYRFDPDSLAAWIDAQAAGEDE